MDATCVQIGSAGVNSLTLR